jgi:hypothetical protein
VSLNVQRPATNGAAAPRKKILNAHLWRIDAQRWGCRPLFVENGSGIKGRIKRWISANKPCAVFIPLISLGFLRAVFFPATCGTLSALHSVVTYSLPL